MAVANLGLLGTGSATSAGTTLVITNTTGAVIPANTLIHISGTWDNINSVTAPTITSSTAGGAAPTVNHATAVGQGVTTTAGSGVWHQCFRVLTTSTIASGATIATLTSNQSAVKRVGHARGFSGALATLRGTVATGVHATGSPSVATAGTALVAGDLVIGSVSNENNAQMTADADTTNGSWSTIVGLATSGGAANTNVNSGSQAKIVIATGVQTYNPTGGVLDSVACVYSLVPVPDPAITQAAYRWYEEGTESGATPYAAQNTAVVGDITNGDATGTLRIRLQSTTAVAVPATDDFQLQYEKNLSGSWTNVTAASTAAATYDSPNLTNQAATTNRLTGGTGTFVAGKVSEDSLMDDLGWAGNNHTELVYALKIKAADVVKGDTLRFRVLRNNTTTEMTYSVTPTIDITQSVLATVTLTATSTLTATGTATAPPATPVADIPIDFSSATWVKSAATATTTRLTLDNDIPGLSIGETQGTYSLDESRVFCKIAQPHDSGFFNMELNVAGAQGVSHYYRWEGSFASPGNGVFIPYWAKDAIGGNGTSTPWDPAKPYFSIRETAGTVYFERSATGQPGSWEILGSTTVLLAPANLNALYLSFYTLGSALSGVGDVWVESLNTPGVAAPAVTQQKYAFYSDGTQTGSSTRSTTDNPLTAEVFYGDLVTHLRIRLQSTTAVAVPSTDDWQLQWEKNASGTWTNVTSGGSTVAAYASASLTDGEALTKRLATSPSTGSYVSGKVSEDGLVDDLGWTGNNYTEVLYSIILKQADLAHGDTLRFRVLKNGATTDLTYTLTPTANVHKIAVPAADITSDFTSPDWTPYGDTVSVTSTRLTLPGGAISNGAYTTGNDYSLVDSRVFFKVAQLPTTGQLFLSVQRLNPPASYFDFYMDASTLTADDNGGDLASVAWDPAKPFLSFRYDSGTSTMYWERSQTGQPGTWETVYSGSYPLTEAAHHYLDFSAPAAITGEGWIESVNTPEAPVVVGAVALTATSTLTATGTAAAPGAATPTVVGAVGNQPGGATSNAPQVTLPAGIQNGDVGLFLVCFNNETSTPSVPAQQGGWTQVGSTVIAGTSIFTGALFRHNNLLASHSSQLVSSTLSGGAARWSAAAIVVRGADSTFDASVTATFTGTADTTLDYPEITPTSDNDLLVLISGLRYLAASPVGVTHDADWTEGADVGTTNSSNPKFGATVATRALTGQAGVAQTGDSGTTASDSREATWLIAYKGTGVAGPPTVQATVALTATSTLTTTGTVEHFVPATVPLTATSTLSATAVREPQASVSLVAISTLTTTAVVEKPATVSLTGTSTLTTTGTVEHIVQATVALTATSILTTQGTVTYLDEVLADFPAAVWVLDETSGTVMEDTSGNNRDGTRDATLTTGASLLPGQVAFSTDFPGTNKFNRVPLASWYQTPSITVEAVFVSDTATGDQVVAARANYAFGLGSRYSWQMLIQSGRLTYELYINDSATRRVLQSGVGSIVAGTRYHAALTYDGTTVRGYLNGTEVATNAMSGVCSPGLTDITIGRPDYTSAYFDGRINTVAFYPTPLSATRISDHYLKMPALAGVTAATVALTASSSLSTTGVRAQPASAALTATSTLTTTAVRVPQAAASLTATSTLTATAIRQPQATVNLAASSSLTTTGTVIIPVMASVALTAVSTLSAAAVREPQAAVSLVAASTLTTTTVRVVPTTTSLTATSTLTATAVRAPQAAVSLVAASTLTTTAVRVVPTTTALIAASTLSVGAVVTEVAAVALTATSTLTATVTTLGAVFAAADLTAVSTLTATGVRIPQASVSLVTGSTLITNAVRVVPTTTALTAASTLTATSVREPQAAASLVAASTLTATSFQTRQAVVALSATSTLTPLAVGVAVISSTVALTASSTLTAAGVRIAPASAALAAVSTLTATGVRQPQAAVSLVAASTLTATGVRTAHPMVALTAVSTLSVTAVGVGITQATVALTATSTLITTAVRQPQASVSLTAASILSTAVVRVRPTTVALTASSTLTTAGTQTAPVSTLPADFTDPVWIPHTGTQSVTPTTLTMTGMPEDNSGLYTDYDYTLDESRVFCRVGQLPTTGFVNIEVYEEFGSTWIYWHVGADGTLYAEISPANFTSTTWDPAKPFLSIRENGGTVYLERSATGQPGTWEIVYSHTYTLLSVPLTYSIHLGWGGTGTAIVTHLNTAASIQPGAIALTAASTMTVVAVRELQAMATMTATATLGVLAVQIVPVVGIPNVALTGSLHAKDTDGTWYPVQAIP